MLRSCCLCACPMGGLVNGKQAERGRSGAWLILHADFMESVHLRGWTAAGQGPPSRTRSGRSGACARSLEKGRAAAVPSTRRARDKESVRQGRARRSASGRARGHAAQRQPHGHGGTCRWDPGTAASLCSSSRTFCVLQTHEVH